MKLFVVLSLASVAIGGMDYEMVQKWQKLKAMESCWGEENMKLVMVDMKKAIAKCSHEDAPELSLPPYRSAYTMINKGDDYEQINDMATMFAKMMQQMKRNRNTFSPYSSMSSNSNHGDSKMETMKMMMQMMKMKNMMKNNDYSSSSYNSDNAFDMFSEMFSQEDNHRSSSDYKNPMGRMSQFKNMFNSMRFKRAAGDNLDLGDRLVEKLAEQRHHMEAKIGNMTCVMRELNVLDASNNID